MGNILFAEQEGVNVLKLVGDIRAGLAPTITHFLNQIGHQPGMRAVVIDLREAHSIDSTSLGLLAKISLRCQEALDNVPTIVSTSPDINRILVSMGFDNVFVIVNEFEEPLDRLGELPVQLVSEAVLCDQVLEAHRVLMSLNKHNEEAFQDLVKALEQEKEDITHSQHRLRAV
ncbi:MAG: STAS domain-containing protein [Pseudomonadales bacterium]